MIVYERHSDEIQKKKKKVINLKKYSRTNLITIMKANKNELFLNFQTDLRLDSKQIKNSPYALAHLHEPSEQYYQSPSSSFIDIYEHIFIYTDIG